MPYITDVVQIPTCMMQAKYLCNVGRCILYKERFYCAFVSSNFGINRQKFNAVVAITSVEAPQMLHALNSFHHCKSDINTTYYRVTKFVMKTGCETVCKCVQVKTCESFKEQQGTC